MNSRRCGRASDVPRQRMRPSSAAEHLAGVHRKGNVGERALFAIALAQAGHLHQRGDAVGSTVKEDGARHRHACT